MAQKGIAALALVSILTTAAASGPPHPTPTPTPAPPKTTAGDTSISLDLKDADLKDVLATFARLERFNLVLDPEVKGAVTVRLHDVPWDQALDLILRSNGFGYVREGNILRVGLPAKLAER